MHLVSIICSNIEVLHSHQAAMTRKIASAQDQKYEEVGALRVMARRYGFRPTRGGF